RSRSPSTRARTEHAHRTTARASPEPNRSPRARLSCPRGRQSLTRCSEPEARMLAGVVASVRVLHADPPGSVLLWVPMWISTQTGGMLKLGAARWIGLPVLIIGVGGLLWCIWDFGRRGKGTLAPVDPPRFVVRGGLHRVVRNPMYLSVLIALGGEALL